MFCPTGRLLAAAPVFDRFVSLGSTLANSRRYTVAASLFSDNGWTAPLDVADLGTDEAYDYLSARYPQNWSNQGHAGVDYRASVGTGVRAVSEGIIQFAYTDPTPLDSQGGPLDTSRIHIEHTAADGTKFLVIYGHVSPGAGMVEGRRVHRGVEIGTIVAFGSPSHIHFELSENLKKQQFGYTRFGEHLPPMHYFVDKPAIFQPNELNDVKQNSWFSKEVQNCITLGVFSGIFTSSATGDDLWHRINAPISRQEFHLATNKCRMLLGLGVASALSSPDGFLRLGELVLICRDRFDFGVAGNGSIDTFKTYVKRMGWAAYKRPRDGTFSNYNLIPSLQPKAGFLGYGRRGPWVPANGIIQLAPGPDRYVPIGTNNDGYDLPVSRALCAMILNNILQYRAEHRSGPLPTTKST